MIQLKKVIKLRTVVSTSAGMALATSCYLAGLQVANMVSGDLAWISILIAGLLALLSSLNFSELTSLYPTAAGIKLFIQNAFSEKTAIIIGMFYVVLGISMVGAESYLLSSVLSHSFHIFSLYWDRLFWIIFFIIFVGLINFRGVKITGIVQDILTYSMLSFLILVSLYAFWKHGFQFNFPWHQPNAHAGSILQAAGVGIFLYVGYEWVTPLAEETTDYRMISKGMMIAIGLLSVTYALFIVAMHQGLTEAQLRSGTPIPHILFARNLLGSKGVALFVFMSILASVTSFNAGLLNTSRFTYAMARDNVLPRSFSKLHLTYATPWMAILGLVLFSIAISLVIFFTGQYLYIIMMAAALECFIYVVMAICVIRLRRKIPETPRDFKIPFGLTFPVLTILVFTGLLIGIFADVTRDYNGRVLFQNYWVAFGMALFFLFTTAYTLWVVPKLKQKAAVRAATRKRRRPGKN